MVTEAYVSHLKLIPWEPLMIVEGPSKQYLGLFVCFSGDGILVDYRDVVPHTLSQHVGIYEHKLEDIDHILPLKRDFSRHLTALVGERNAA